MKESKVEEIHEELLEVEQAKLKKKSKWSIPDNYKMWIALGLIVAGIYFWNKGGIGKNEMIYIAIIVAILYFMFQSDYNVPWISEKQAKAALFAELKWKQVNSYDGEYEISPDARVVITGPGVLRFLEGRPWRWVLGYQIKFSHGLIENWSADLDCYNAKIIKLRKRPEGFIGSEGPDLKYINSPQMTAMMRAEKSLGRAGVGRYYKK